MTQSGLLRRAGRGGCDQGYCCLCHRDHKHRELVTITASEETKKAFYGFTTFNISQYRQIKNCYLENNVVCKTEPVAKSLE